MRRTLLDQLATRVGSTIDDALLAAARFRFGRHTGPRGDRSRLLDEATEFYRRPEILSGAGFFLPPDRALVRERRVSLLPDGERVDIAFDSGFEPRWERMRLDYWKGVTPHPNRVAHVRMLRHTTPRPSLICLHGYATGQWFIEERSFVARWLYEIGLDVSLFVLPFHAQRAARPGPPAWPSPHVARTNEGFGHAMSDLVAFIGWLRERGAPSVSVCGMSLGAFSAALLATLKPLDFAALMIPVASWPELFWWHGEGRRERADAEAEGITLLRMKAAMAVTAPLGRTPLLDGERVLVLDAEGDRIAPPVHADWLAEHFRARRITLAGGHLLLARGAPFKAIARRMRELSLLE